MVTSKAAYIYTLVSSGVIIVSTYTTLRTNDKNAWKVVQNRFTTSLANIPNRIKKFSDDCLNNVYSTGEINAERILMENSGLGN